MAVQLSITARNSRLDTIETTVGASPKLRIFSGSLPSDCASPDPSGQLAEITLPVDWMNDAASGQKTLLGAWSGPASTPGTAASFRIKNSAGTTCHLQGTVGQGSGDLSLDNTNIASGQTITVTAFTLTDANA